MALKYIKKGISLFVTTLLAILIVVPSTFLGNIPITKAATYTVSTNADSGAGSFRQAIIDANANAGADTINFTASGTITISSTMDAITESVIIDGTTAPDTFGGVDVILGGSSSIDCMQITGGSSTTIKGIGFSGCRKGILATYGASGIILGGAASREYLVVDGSTVAGISLEGAGTVTILGSQFGINAANKSGISITDGTTITIGGSGTNEQNEIVSSTDDGILVGASTGVTIKGNYIGQKLEGSIAGNGRHGIFVNGLATSLTIGGSLVADRNYILGNSQNGIKLSDNTSSAATVKQNYIGISATGFVAANGAEGIYISTPNNVIGATSSQGNVISGNTLSGVYLTGANAYLNSIVGNTIGLDGTGLTAKGNGANGILIDGGNAGSYNTIEGNTISSNTQNGIKISDTATGTTYIYSNKIGLGTDGETALGNSQAGISTQAKVMIGVGSDDTKQNHIGSNGFDGVLLSGTGTSLSVVANNLIGASTSGTARPNGLDGIKIDQGANGVTIGSNTNTVQIISNNNNSGVSIDGSNTDGIAVLQNHFNGNGLKPINITNGANGSLESTIGNITANTSGISGTSNLAAESIAYMHSGTGSNATFISRSTIATDATFRTDLAIENGINYWIYAVETGTNRTTVPTSTGLIVADNTAPTEPILTSSTGTTSNPTYIPSGTKEIWASVHNAGTQIVAANSSTGWTASSTSLVEGTNTFTLDSRDLSANVSSTGTFTVTLDTIPPIQPQVSFNANATTATTVLTGTGEASSTVFINNVFTTTAAVDGTFSVTLTLQSLYNNQFIIATEDAVNNRSAGVHIVIGAQGSGGSGGPSSSGTSTSGTGTTGTGTTVGTQYPAQTTQANTQQDAGQSMAGEQETAPIKNTQQNTIGTKATFFSNNTRSEVVGIQPKQPDPIQNTQTTNQTKAQNTYYQLFNNQNQVPTQSAKPVQSTQAEQPGAETPGTEPSIQNGTDKPTLQPVPIIIFNQKELAPTFTEKILETKFIGPVGEDNIPNWWKEDNFGTDKVTLNESEDTDADGVSDLQEFFYGSDPKQSDSDGDGIPDAREIENKGNPSNFDSDGDGIPDGQEKEGEGLIYKQAIVDEKIIQNYIAENKITLDESKNETLGNIDSDKDGISDKQELGMGTDPKIADSDSDGLTDGQEVLIYDTNPKKISEIKGVGIANFKTGQKTPAGPQVIMGASDSPDTEIEIHAIDEDGNDIIVAKTTTDANGSYSTLTETMPEGKFTLNTVAIKNGATYAVSNPVEMEVSGESKVESPKVEIKTEGNQISLSGELDSEVQLVVVWRSLVLSNTIVADQNFAINAPEELEPGEHTATIYAVDTETGDRSAPVQVSFTVSTTGFASGDTKGISPIITIAGSTIILLSLIGLAIYRRRRNDPPKQPPSSI